MFDTRLRKYVAPNWATPRTTAMPTSMAGTRHSLPAYSPPKPWSSRSFTTLGMIPSVAATTPMATMARMKLASSGRR